MVIVFIEAGLLIERLVYRNLITAYCFVQRKH